MSPAQRDLLTWYDAQGRDALPWRVVRDPYYTLVSEFMLQQTQVERVVPKFEAFVERFPTIAALAQASQSDVLRLWQGLGYNSRAIRLHGVARAVLSEHDGVMPRERAALLDLPGIGPYTAAAIRAFAYDLDDAPLDTNVRRIVHRVTLGVEYPAKATSAQLDEAARAFAAPGKAHDWNSAMMDLGASVCTARAPKCLICPLRAYCAAAPIDAASLEIARKANAKKASPQNAMPFERTNRYARGRIIDRLRELPAGERISLLDLHAQLKPVLADRTLEEVRALVSILECEGLIATDDERVSLRD